MDEREKSQLLSGASYQTGQTYEEWSRQRRLAKGNAATLVMESVKDKPDEVAGVLNMAKSFGQLSGYVPPFEMAKQFQSDFEREITRQQNLKILKDRPKLSLWLRDPEFAGLAKDDLANLGWLEGFGRSAVRTGVAAGDRMGQMFSQWRLETALSDYRHGELYEEGHWAFPHDTPEMMAASQKKIEERVNYWAGKVDYFSKTRERNPKSHSATRYETAANSGGKDAGFWQALGNYAGSFVTDPIGGLAWALETAGESAPQLSAAIGATVLTKNPRFGMAAMGGGSYATERYTSPEEFFHELGLDLSKPEDIAKILADPELMKQAAERGVIRGVVIGAMDTLSVGLAGKVMAKNPMKEAIAQSVTQMVLGGGGEYLARVAAGQKVDWNEVMAEAFAELATTPVDMVVAGRKLEMGQKAADVAQVTKEKLRELSSGVIKSALRQRMPDRFGQFAADALKGSGHETIYVNAEALNEYFQSLDLDGGQVISTLEGVSIEDFNRALTTAGDVAIPTSTYAAQIAGSQLDGFIQEHGRFAAQDMSAGEAAAFNEQAETLLREAAQEAAQVRRQAEASLSMQEQIYDEMVHRLRLAGRTTEIATNEAMIYPAFYHAQAGRAGLTMEEMLARYPLPEIRGDKAWAGMVEQQFNQSDYDRGGRGAQAAINGEVVLEPLKLNDLAKIEAHRQARESVPKGEFSNVSGDKVNITNTIVKKWFSRNANELKRNLAPHLVEAFKQSVTYHKGEDGFSYAAGLIELDGKQVGVRFVIKKEKGNPDKLYQIEGIELPPISQTPLINENSSGLARGANTRKFSVAQAVQAFNRLPVGSYPLFQARRGSIQFGQEGAAVVHLFARADLSTLLHESGHFFLNIMQDMAARGEASSLAELDAIKAWWRDNAQGVVKDANVAVEGAGVEAADIEAYLEAGTTGNAVKDRAIDIGLQEQFARGFEAYVMEGKAPSVGLQAAFEKFRAWLIAIYKKLTSLDVKMGEEIRAVFDRMLATDEAIEAAQAGAGEMALTMPDAASLGLTEEEHAKLMGIRQAAQDEAKARLLHETMKPLKRAQERWFKAERAKVREEVGREVNAWRHYRAFEGLANGRWLGDEAQNELGDLRLNKQQLVERYGKDILKSLPRGKRAVYAAKEGADIDGVADMFGFKSGDEMVQAFRDMVPRIEAIEAQTDRVMVERHGDVLRDGAIEEHAVEVVHNDKRAEWLAAELKAVTQVAGVRGAVSMEQARAFARQEMASMQVGQAQKSDRFLSAERKSGHEAAKLWGVLARQGIWQQQAKRRLAQKARGDAKGQGTDEGINAQIETVNARIDNYNETVARFIRAKQSQLLNHALYVESRRVEREVDSLLKRVARLNRAIGKIRSGRKRLGETALSGDYIEPIEAILNAYEFGKVSGTQLDKRAALASFIEKMEEEGRANELAIPEDVLADSKAVNYQRLSVEHLRGVVDALKNIEHMARLKGKLLMANKQRDFDEAKGVIIDALAKNLEFSDVEWIKKQGFVESIKKAGRSYVALVQNATHILRRIDGRKDLGAVYELIKSPLDEASFNERRMRQQGGEDFKKLYAVYTRDEQRQMAVLKTYDTLGGRAFSKWNVIAMALNMGNEGNLSRLTNSRARQHLTGQEVEAVKGLLTKRDWDFVQSVWDYLETWKAKIAERDRRLRGIEPEWVEARAVETPYGTYRGGYYPIKYDGELGGHRRMADEVDEVFAQMTAGSYARATTKQGHLKARLGAGAQSLSLDIGMMGKHVMEVIHDLQFNEPVVNAWRLFNNNEVEQAFLKANMKEAYRALKLWVQDVGAGQIMADNDLGRLMNKLRGGFTLSKLGYNAYTVVQQPLGLGQSAEMVGAKNLDKVMLEYSRDAKGMVEEVLAKSNIMWERRDTFNKDVMDTVAQANIAHHKAGRVKAAIDDYIVPYGLMGLVGVQFYAVDVPTWVAAYRKGLGQFDGNEKRAIHYADMAISASQASGLFLDRSAIERGTLSASIRQNPFVLLMTTLGSYFFAKQNRVIERTQDLRAGKITPQKALEYAYHMSLLLLFEAVVIESVKMALRTNDDDDDDSLMAAVLLGGLENYLGGVPVVRDMVGAAKGFDAGTYAAMSNSFVRPFVRLFEGKLDGSFTKSSINLMGVMTRLPSTQTNRLVDAWLREGQGEDVSVMEVIFGRARK